MDTLIPGEEGRRGYLTAPTAEQIMPTPREVAALTMLWNFFEQSKNCCVILGVPPNQQPR